MSNNDKKDPPHIRVYRIINYVLVIGAFLLIAAPISNKEETLNSYLGRLIFAGFIAFLIWLRMKKATNEAADAWESMQISFNRPKITYNCPQCGLPRPRRRFPASINQFLWGGWTCKQCGCEVDSIGRKKISN